MTNDEAEIYNEIYIKENPVTTFMDNQSPYYDYYCKINEYPSFNKNMRVVDMNLVAYSSLSPDQYVANILIVYYATLFEMFSKDNLVATFYSYFPNYCIRVMSNDSGYLFKDINGDTFLHYCSNVFNCYGAMLQLYSLARKDSNTVTNPLFLNNISNVTPKGILMLK